MRLREAGLEDGPMLCEFFRQTPMEAGTAVVLDRGPEFFALLKLKGLAKTFLLFDGDRLTGTATALWHSARDGGREVTVGEVLDLRVAEPARGGRASWQLLGAVREAFDQAGVDWISCLIMSDNHMAAQLVNGRAGLPRLEPLARYASVHYLSWRAPMRATADWTITRASPAAGPALAGLFGPAHRASRFAPSESVCWPDPASRSSAWLAIDGGGRPLGALLLWDGDKVRRIRIARYRVSDAPLRLLARAAEAVGAAVALPAPGEVLRTWASRGFVLAHPEPTLTRALLGAALREAVDSGRHVVQINLEQSDPLLPLLPRYPRSTYWTTLYCAPYPSKAGAAEPHPSPYYADIALA
jgi:hypothetical protein